MEMSLKSLPTSEIAQSYWQSQKEDWDCWLNAISIAFSYLGHNYDYAQLLEALVDTSVKISDTHGGYFPYLSLIAKKLNYSTVLHCSLNKHLYELSSNTNFRKSKCNIEDIELSKIRSIQHNLSNNKSPRSYLYSSLEILYRAKPNNNTVIHTNNSGPNVTDMKKYLNEGKPVLVNVICKDYYKIMDDDSNHVLTLIPVCDSVLGFHVLDGYIEKGFDNFKDWEQSLKCAESYDWNTWSDWMLAIDLNPSFAQNKGAR